jgi:hypothetical protein
MTIAHGQAAVDLAVQLCETGLTRENNVLVRQWVIKILGVGADNDGVDPLAELGLGFFKPFSNGVSAITPTGPAAIRTRHVSTPAGSRERARAR